MLISCSARRLVPLFCAAAAAFGAARPSFAGAPQSMTLRYEAPTSCPTRDQFREAVTRRLGHGVDFDDEHSGSVASVRIATTDTGATAEVSFESPGVAANLREFATSSCNEAVEAAALVVALIIDPAIATPATRDGDRSAQSAAVEPASAPRVHVTESPGPRRAPPSPPPAPAVVHSPLTVGPAVALELGIAPNTLLAGGVRLGFDPRPDRWGAWSPQFSLSALAARTGVMSPSAELGTFTWISSQLDGCSSKWRVSSALSFRPCVSAQLGVLAARGNDAAISRPSTATRPWASIGAIPTLSWHLHPVEFGFGVGARAALTPYEFIFENPLRNVYTVSKLSLSLEFSVNIEP